LSFYYRELRPKKKLLQFTQRITKKNLAGIGEPMVPTFGGLANIDPITNMWQVYTRLACASDFVFSKWLFSFYFSAKMFHQTPVS
jgi:hypothetical protein